MQQLIDIKSLAARYPEARPIVQSCPITSLSQGVVRMPAWLVAELAGTVRAEKEMEWLILLTGEIHQDGWEVIVDGYFVPDWQKRSAAHVRIDDFDDGGVAVIRDGKFVRADSEYDRVVGVCHSHHGMGATFSGTDHNELNPNFPFSIVISYNATDEESVMLGWSYQATGKVKLPCGSVGYVDFKVDVDDCVEWASPEIVVGQHQGPVKDFGNCQSQSVVRVSTLWQQRQAACGLQTGAPEPIPSVFGQTAEIVPKLPAPFVLVPAKKGWTTKTSGGLASRELKSYDRTAYDWDPLDDYRWPSVETALPEAAPYDDISEEDWAEWQRLEQLTFNEMTDQQFIRYYILEEKLWGREVYNDV